MEDKRIEKLVIKGLEDKNVTPLTKEDFIDMKRDLVRMFDKESKLS